MSATQTQQTTPVKRMSNMLSTESVKAQFHNALKEHSDLFLASILDVYGSDPYLQKCDPGAVIKECLKAATLRLPINKQLGFAYIVPYKDTPTFIIGYKGLIQLAMRTGLYRTINAGPICEGELKEVDKLTGVVDLSGRKISDKIVGYFAHFETTNGFRKTMYMSHEDMIKYARKHSKSYNASSSPWKSDPDAMGTKTMLRQLLSKYGVMSIEFAHGMAQDNDESYEAQLEATTQMEANQGEIIDVDPGEAGGEVVDSNDGPGY